MVRLTLNRFITSGLVTAGVALATSAHAAFNCASSNPADWPPSSKPYFMLAVDTSGSMVSCTNPTSGSASCKSGYVDNSCGLEPTRLNDAKCAMTKTIQAFAGEVNFGLMTYATKLQGCSAGAVPDSCTNANGSCPGGANQPIEDGEHYAANGCTVSTFTNPDNNPSNTCGNTPDCGASTTNLAQIYTGATVAGVTLPGANWPNGGNILVDMLKDPTWSPTSTPPSNTAQLLAYFDGRTDNSQEIYASGYTPLEGILRTAHQYYAAGWSSAWANNNYCATGGATIDHPSPIDPVNDRPCRSLNVILVTDGDEDCNGTPANAATALDTVGVVIQGVRVPIKTYVIGFAGATTSSLDAIAKAGGTTASYSASNEVTLSEALASIISGSVSPEVCDNTDNNCNGCVDEGFKKYCDRNRTAETLAFLQTAANNPDSTMCCTWTSDAAGGDRSKCLAAFSGSISAANPQGSKYFLPCWDPTTNDATPSADWLCTNPGEACDNKDNNCDVDIDPTQADFATNTVDELEQKCGSPLHCPTKETCNGQDDDCDGVIDNAPGSGVPYSICPNSCQATTELCNGCDDDCDGIADNGVGAIACGFSPPAACLGTETCKTAGMAVPVGGCVAGVTKPGVNEYSACSAKGTAEVCDGIDNDCDGVVDDNVTDAGGACTPNPGDPTTGACHAGTKVCQNGKLVCVGYVGPTTEILRRHRQRLQRQGRRWRRGCRPGVRQRHRHVHERHHGLRGRHDRLSGRKSAPARGLRRSRQRLQRRHRRRFDGHAEGPGVLEQPRQQHVYDELHDRGGYMVPAARSDLRRPGNAGRHMQGGNTDLRRTEGLAVSGLPGPRPRTVQRPRRRLQRHGRRQPRSSHRRSLRQDRRQHAVPCGCARLRGRRAGVPGPGGASAGGL